MKGFKMSHNKDVLVSEFLAERKGIPFSSIRSWTTTRLDRSYRIDNRKLASVTKSFLGTTDNYTQVEVDSFDRKSLNLRENETAIAVTENGSSGNYGTIVIL